MAKEIKGGTHWIVQPGRKTLPTRSQSDIYSQIGTEINRGLQSRKKVTRIGIKRGKHYCDLVIRVPVHAACATTDDHLEFDLHHLVERAIRAAAKYLASRSDGTIEFKSKASWSLEAHIAEWSDLSKAKAKPKARAKAKAKPKTKKSKRHPN